MAYLQARAGIARSGVTYTGWTPPYFQLFINGEAVQPMQNANWVLSDRFGQAPTLRFDLQSTVGTSGGTETILASSDKLASSGLVLASAFFALSSSGPPLARGSDIKLTYAIPNEYWFGGTLLQMEMQPFSEDSDKLIWRCTATGYQWLMDRYDQVLAKFYSLGVNTIVSRLLSTHTDGGFRVGYIPSSLGNLPMTFTFELVSSAINRVAVASGATGRITPDKVVDVYETYPEAALPTLTQADIFVNSLLYNEDLTQVRTRILVEGSGSVVAAPAGAGATSISVEDTSSFLEVGGQAVAAQSVITYMARSAGSGPGNLTGVTGLTQDLAVSDPIQTISEVEDLGAQGALASVLGGGLSGQATHYLQDRRLSIEEATARGNAQLDMFSTSLPELSFTYKTVKRHLRSGRLLTVAITEPHVINGTFLVQSVTTTVRGDQIGGPKVTVFQHVEASRFTRTLGDLLRQVEG